MLPLCPSKSATEPRDATVKSPVVPTYSASGLFMRSIMLIGRDAHPASIRNTFEDRASMPLRHGAATQWVYATVA